MGLPATSNMRRRTEVDKAVISTCLKGRGFRHVGKQRNPFRGSTYYFIFPLVPFIFYISFYKYHEENSRVKFNDYLKH